MKRFIRKFLLLGAVLCSVLGIALTACQPSSPPEEPRTATYTVTVSGSDEHLSLETIKVQLLEGSSPVGEKTLTDGKAVFEGLPAKTYTATLTGVSEGFTFADVTLTPAEPSATIAIVRTATHFVSVQYGASNDVFGQAHAASPASGVKAEVYASATETTPIASAVTNENGVAVFTLGEDADGGIVRLSGYHPGFAFSPATAELEEDTDITLTPKDTLGKTSAVPLLWTLGENELPFTEAILAQYTTVYAAFIPDETGTYTLTASSESANVSSDALSDLLGGAMDLKQVVSLTQSVPCVFACSSSGSSDGNFGYSVLIEKGGTPAEKPEPPVDDPTEWKGSGTESDPYIITKLAGDYSVKLTDKGVGEYDIVYLSYTASEDANFTVTSSDQDFYMRVTGGAYTEAKPGSYSYGMSDPLLIKKGVTYLFAISPYDESATGDLTITFKIEEGYSGWLPSWEGEGKYNNPYLITELVGDYTVVTSNGGSYFKYTAAEAGEYTLTASSAMSVRLYQASEYSLKHSMLEDRILAADLAADGKCGLSLEAGKDYILVVLPAGADGEPGEFTLTFSIAVGKYENEGGGGGETPPPPVGDPDGSAELPFPIDAFPGKHDFDGTKTTYYTFTPSADATYRVTPLQAIYLKFTTPSTAGSLSYSGQDRDSYPYKDFALKGGTQYVFSVMGYGPSPSADASYVVHEVNADGELIVNELVGSHYGTVKYTNSGYVPNVYVYSAQEAGEYTFKLVSGDVSVSFSGTQTATPDLNTVDGTAKVVLAEGETLLFTVDATEKDNTQLRKNRLFELEVTVSEPEEEDPWEGSGTGQDPYILDDILGEHELKGSQDGVYYRYISAEAKTVYATSSDEMKVTIDGYSFDSSKMLFKQYTLGTGSITIKVYTLDGSSSKVNLTVSETAPQGASADDPIALGELAGSHTIEKVGEGLYYSATVAESGSYSLVSTTPINISINGTNYAFNKADVEHVVELEEGTVSLWFRCWGATIDAVGFTATKVETSSEPDGSESNPFPLVTGAVK